MPIRVFISYSQESDEHSQRVEELAARLRRGGVDAEIDQYETAPSMGWPRWMEDQIDRAEYILLVSSRTYNDKLRFDRDTARGRGVRFEGSLLLGRLYRAGMKNEFIIPVLFDGTTPDDIPSPLKSFTHYHLWEQYDRLYRHVTGQHSTKRPPLGQIQFLPNGRETEESPATPSTSAQSPQSDSPMLERTLNTAKGRVGTSQLFGVEEQSKHLWNSLHDPTSNSIISIVGIGGIGKTALAANALCNTLEGPTPRRHAWVSIRQEEFDYFAASAPGRGTSFKLEHLVTEVASQLELTEIVRSAASDRLSQLVSQLSERPYLVVIDNIETEQELQVLAPLLRKAERAFPSQFILTSRTPCYPIPTNSIRLDELQEKDALSLLRFEAARRNIDSVIEIDINQLRPIYELVGGNPLALNLALGLLDRLPVDRVVKDLSTGSREASGNLYTWIYSESWRLMSRNARFLLILISKLSSEGVSWERLSFISELEEDALDDALRELINLSLVRQTGDLATRSYSTHRLTVQFCANPGSRLLSQEDSDFVQQHLSNALRANATFSLELLGSLGPQKAMND